jgi:hypothetical protein
VNSIAINKRMGKLEEKVALLEKKVEKLIRLQYNREDVGG